jgi:glycine oxidase
MSPTEHARRPDAIVIGAGIVGLSCAREMAAAGLRVTVFEMAGRRGASWAAAGMLAPWSDWPADPDGLAAREEALSLYPAWVERLRQECGAPIEVDLCGALVIGPRIATLLADFDALARRTGARRLTPHEIREMHPLLHTEIEEAILLPREGYAQPHDLMRALHASCGALGVTVREEPVLRLIDRSGRIGGVVTPTGEIESGAVLDAAGAWAMPFARDGAEVRPVRGQLLTLRPSQGAPRLRTVVQAEGIYLVPRGNGSVIVGATSEEVGFEPGVTARGIRSLLDGAARIAPPLDGWVLEETWSGFRPFREGGPWIGADPDHPGLLHAIGLYRHGILLAPFAARRIRACMGI